MKKFKIGIIGSGARSVSYAKTYSQCDEVEVAAIADPSRQNRLVMMTMSGLSPEKICQYDTWQELYERHTDLDGVVIATPNYLHRESAVPFIGRKIPVALEKPLTTTMKDSEAILAAIAENKSQVLLGFVLRSTPFYRKIHELLSADKIGRVLTIQADELASYGVSSIISRSPWRRYTKYSGGSMMEKSSHDIDLLNWLLGSKPVAVNSFGGNLLFSPNPLLPENCDNCPLSGQCKYFENPQFSAAAGDEVLQKFIREDNSLCIYNINKDVMDNQAVSIQYANGAIANFMLSFNCSGERSGRNFHAIGTRGRIWGDIDDNKVYLHTNDDEKTECFELESKAGGGHNGGDSNHAYELVKMIKDPAYYPAQDAYAGYLSNAVCIAADLSVAEARQIHFRYGHNEYIDFT